ncbi:penicillin-binding transpeptidase domain-containing protein [Metabacillus herbersteinensis]|uniref:serine-type D-Ala-D-Ala carboxypeptidase n=1 Tax=Metabacillus herbersteinensis TaxID=283816 RepID=A0ABV6GIL4_9BACI
MKKLFTTVLLLTLLVIISACNKGPTAEERFSEYIALWNDEKFSEMYDRLSATTKESVSKDEFVERYEVIYEAISASELKVTYEKAEEEVEPDDNGQVKLPFSLSMESVAGPISFDQEVTLIEEETEEDKNWNVNWTPAMIFPQLKEGEDVRVTSGQPVRGQIFDRNEQGLAVNGTVNEIGVDPGKLGENEADTIQKLAQLLQLEVEEIESKLNQSWVKDGVFVPIKKISPDNRELLEKLIALPGVQKQNSQSRYYPLGEAGAHLIGYTGSITAEQLEELKDKGYSSSSKIGKAGLEQVYEDRLKGEVGFKIFIEQSQEVIAEKAPVDGENVTLTIDLNTQKTIYEQLKGDAGTAVALHPKTGETLAMVSSPAYDPNEFVFGMSGTKYDELANNPLQPLRARFNKTFSPGSAIKPLTAAIGLKTETITPADVKTIKGKTWKKDSSWGNYFVTRVSSDVEQVNLHDALIYSDNIYFAQLALDIGKEKFTEGMQQFGFGEEIDYVFPTEKSTIANEDLSSEQLLADSGFGQGQVQMSPLHLAATYTTFLNEGSMLKPYLEKKDNVEPINWHAVVPSVTASTILDDLKQVVENPNGTANDPKLPGIALAGKTGTAELKQTKEEDGKENGWFVAVNTDDPSLLIAMMVEDVKDRRGSHYVVPKVKTSFEQLMQ